MSKTILCLSGKEKLHDARMILLSFHWVGGNANSFRFIVRHLQDLPVLVYGVNLPVRYPNDKNPPLKNISDAVDFLFQHVVAHSIEWNPSNLPIILLGHSCGGILAYELLQKVTLNSSNFNFGVRKIIISASIPPLQLVQRNARLAHNSMINDSKGETKQIPSFLKSDEELISYIRKNDGIPANLPLDFVKDMLPVIRNDYRLYDCYNSLNHSTSTTVCVPMTLIIPTEDHSTGEDIQSMRDWKYYTTSSCNIEEIPGGSHFYLIKEEFQSNLFNIVRHNIQN